MAGPETLGDLAVVLRALVGVLDDERDRRAGGQALEHAGEDAHGVRFLPLRGEARLAGAAAVEEGLDVGFGERDARRAAVDHAADRRPVALAPGGDAEQVAEAIVRHDGRRQWSVPGQVGFTLDRDVGRGRVLHADDMVAAIDVVHLAGDAGGQVREQIDAGAADLLDGDVARERGIELVPAQDVAEIADAACRKRLDRPGADRVDADVLRRPDRPRDSAPTPPARPSRRP